MQTLLGVIYENENKADGMQNILDNLQKYVPSFEEKGTIHYVEQGIVGDQLTVERGVNGLFEVSNGFTAEERHEGLHFEIADFHGGMKFLEVTSNHNYSIIAITDATTLTFTQAAVTTVFSVITRTETRSYQFGHQNKFLRHTVLVPWYSTLMGPCKVYICLLKTFFYVKLDFRSIMLTQFTDFYLCSISSVTFITQLHPMTNVHCLVIET